MECKILKSELAGSWYTDDSEQLKHEVDAYLDAVEQTEDDDVMGLILPHAGYRYSGMVAAHGVKQVQGRSFSRVVVIGPSHQLPMRDIVSIPEVTHVETPLGQIEVDRALADRLLKNPVFKSLPRAHTSEHSVQIELPFLQRALGVFKLVPIVCGQLDELSAQHVADALLEQIDEQTLVVVSSDFTHYGPAFDYAPFTQDVQKNLENLDLGAFRFIEQKDAHGFLGYIRETEATICGRSPLAVFLSMLPQQAKVKLLKYDTSGSMTGDWEHCVSYISASISGRWEKVETVRSARKDVLSAEDQAALLKLARYELTHRLYGYSKEEKPPITPALREVMGAFVTLHKQGQLRGCIGEILPRRSIYEAVAEQVQNAAFHDPRFPALTDQELGGVDIEISALTAPYPVASYKDIEIGRHGIVLSKGMYSSVFLPQVAPEQGWDLETTLTNLSIKAGLGADSWRYDCAFNVFEAIVFGEKDG